MALETLFVIGMFATFGVLLLTGYPVAWVLGGTAVIWTAIGVLAVDLLRMLSLPVMLQTKYDKGFAVGTACATGTLGILIPPSIMLVLMADRLAVPEASVGDLFMGALVLALAARRLNLSVLRSSLCQTTRTAAFIFAIFLGATAFSVVLRGLGGDVVIKDALLGLPFGPNGVILTILFAVFLLGFFLDWVEITLIILPLVAPVVQHLGFDLVWFTILFAMCLQTSFLTPPVGFALFYIKGVAPPEIRVTDIYRGVCPTFSFSWRPWPSCS